MCGLVGFWNLAGDQTEDALRSVIRKMTQTLIHRGPDDGGVWTAPSAGLALGHRRLAIVDLSPSGHQPILSHNHRYVLVFNGEIYNFIELRQHLTRLGHLFRGYSDTEVMLAAFCEWGVQHAVQQFNGMFAFALWDQEEKLLHLGRDRFGEKPLYYGWFAHTLFFGSELKALKAHPDFQPRINRNALTLLLRYNCIPSPYCIYEGVYKLLPGTTLTWDGISSQPGPIPYWSAQQVAEAGAASPFKGSEADAIDELNNLLLDAVKLRMIADVPLGAFLSGGVDSSVIVALMQHQSSQPVKTFTIAMHEGTYNESQHAQAVAQYLGTDHTELYVTPSEARAVIPQLPSLYDEPFSDSSQIPTFLISQLAKQSVTVSLSGDGGDELFAGYNRYVWCPNIWKWFGWIPQDIRLIAASSLTSLSPQMWDRYFNLLDFAIPKRFQQTMPGDRLHKLAEALGASNLTSMYQSMVSHWEVPEAVVKGGSEPSTVLSEPHNWAQVTDFVQQMMYLDTVTYLPNDILTKVDRASMGVSLEARVPFLDHRILELAWRLPLFMKVRGPQGKWILRKILYNYLPQSLFERPKTGFGIPIDLWLRGPLRDWAEALLDEQRLRHEGYFNPQPIRQKWEEHLSGKYNWQYDLWDVIMFQAWLEQTS